MKGQITVSNHKCCVCFSVPKYVARAPDFSSAFLDFYCDTHKPKINWKLPVNIEDVNI